MTRQQKYPETKTFHFYNANPKGRITGDCAYRAISVACEIPYRQVVMDAAKMQCETGYDPTAGQGLNKLMEMYGWVKNKQPRKHDNTKLTGSEFCEIIAHKGWRYLADIGGHHVVAIVDKKVWDIWDSTHKCVGNYWTKSDVKK